jgi:hypothetical protein
MAHGRARDERKERQWRRWIAQRQTSGLSVRDFYARHGLAIASFYHWRWVLERRATERPVFVPVQVVADTHPSQASALELVLADGRALRVAPGFDATTLRRLLAVPILERFGRWLETQRPEVLPKSAMGEAIGYALNNWAALVRYTEAGFLAIDNNVSEREMKRIAIGRKNWLTVGSPPRRRGRSAAAAPPARRPADPTASLAGMAARCFSRSARVAWAWCSWASRPGPRSPRWRCNTGGQWASGRRFFRWTTRPGAQVYQGLSSSRRGRPARCITKLQRFRLSPGGSGPVTARRRREAGVMPAAYAHAK